MPADALPETVKCDYKLTVPEVYMTLTRDLIRTEGGLRVLTIDPRSPAGLATPGLPRWALDMETDAFLMRLGRRGVHQGSDEVVDRGATREDHHAVREYMDIADENHTKGTMYSQVRCQKFFITEKGFMGLGHRDTKVGDEVWIFTAGREPFILRRSAGSEEGSPQYDFVGSCCLHGVMQGELFADRPPPEMRHLHIY
ncbi:hypothetical protein GGR56DRAFT_612284 [Xylariaceae sp. FL0804]|nr:hypothetical protein GGR56DRAFT_612284 [Xylariaceae sp. FL0804]